MIGHMDVYGGLSVDDLLDLPTDDFLSSDSVPDCLPSSSAPNYLVQPSIPRHSDALSDILCVPVPAEDAAELEWLSNYMDDSFADYPENSLAAAENHVSICKEEEEEEEEEEENRAKVIITSNGGNTTERGEVERRCTHCASEKTPQWRTGPLGPKTLCTACGVRYKSGRLVPEYRPAASPTFVLTQHSNSHRKVLELRRQKEMLHHQQQQEAAYGRHFRVC